MNQRMLSALFVFLLLFSFGYQQRLTRPDLVQVIYDDSLATGWQNWSWASVDLAAGSPDHSGAHSLGVTFGSGWQGLYLHKAVVDTSGLTRLRFFLHGGGTGGQKMNLFLNLEVAGATKNGPELAVTPPTAGAWSEVQLELSLLNPNGAEITGITWQDSTGHAQPTFYLDDIALINDESPDGPSLSAGSFSPRSLPADGTTQAVVQVHVSDPQGLGDITSVTLEAADLGQVPVVLTVVLHDDGRSNDGAAGDGLYGGVMVVNTAASRGEARLLVTASDAAGHRSVLPLGALTILSRAGGEIPAGLPQHLGWGSNAWSETAGQDWQVNSGVRWNYVYQYITYSWYTQGWGGNFVTRFVSQAWSKGYIPVITVYMILETPPNCGESASCYAQKLQNASTVSTYLAALKEAARQAKGSQPVIFNLEPDFYGYMQQLSNDAGRPAGVRPDDPSSYPVALNVAGYSNDLAGFGRYLVDLLHSTAPNILAAPMASMWATNADPNNSTPEETVQIAQRTAGFIKAMGGDKADLLVVEWSDRDAGSGLRPWWDDQDVELPRPTRAILWENALSAASAKRLLLWQVPVGNMNLDNTCDHYRDNRAAYLFNHPRDLFDAGVFGVVFGGGASCMTSVKTDGGFVAAQGAIAYAPPSAPTGLVAGPTDGSVVPLQWNQSVEPDLWHYRLYYQLQPGSLQGILDVGRRNTAALLLPQAGTWNVRITAIDAMGNESQPSAGVTVLTEAAALRVYLPLARRP